MSDTEPLLSVPGRQSPVAVVFLAWRMLRSLSIVNLIVLFAVLSSIDLPIPGWAVVAIGLLVLGVLGLISWWRFVFVVEEGELRVSRGVLSEERLAIPLNRVQTVSLEQGPLHQILNLTRVSVDTAGSTETEFKFDALERPRAEALNRVVAEHRAQQRGVTVTGGAATGAPTVADLSNFPPPVPGAEPRSPEPIVAEVVAQRSVADLIKIGLTSWPWAGLVFIVPLIAALDELRSLAGIEFIDDFVAQLEDVDNVDNPGEIGLGVSLTVVMLVILGFVVVATVFGWILQTVRAVISNWELTLTRTVNVAGENLRREAGLFNRTSLAANMARVQGVKTDQLPMQRWAGIRRLVLPITGEADLHLPGTTDAEFDQIRHLVFKSEAPALSRGVSRALVFLEVRNSLLLFIPITAIVTLALGWWGLLTLVLVVLNGFAAHRQWRRLRWGFTKHRIGSFRCFLVAHTEDVEFVKAQSVTVRRSRFQRRRGLATFRLRTAEETFEIPMISDAEARALRDLVLYTVETSSRSWM